MTIFNKYKSTTYLNINNALMYNFTVKDNSTKINYIFNYTKKLIRTFIYFTFIIFYYTPFSPLNFKGHPMFKLKLDCSILLILGSNWYENFYKFDC